MFPDPIDFINLVWYI